MFNDTAVCVHVVRKHESKNFRVGNDDDETPIMSVRLSNVMFISRFSAFFRNRVSIVPRISRYGRKLENDARACNL